MSQTIVSVAGAVPLGKGSGIGRWAGRLDAAMGAVVEFLAMLLILVEIAILFSGVIARYVVHVPLVWTDELATILFLWLSLLGAVIALRRGAHIRIPALVDRVGPGASDRTSVV